MAIQLDEGFKGIVGNYWKIIDVHERIIDNETDIVLGLYVSAKARSESVNNILKSLPITLPGVDMTRAEQYIAIMKLDAWLNSKIV